MESNIWNQIILKLLLTDCDPLEIKRLNQTLSECKRAQIVNLKVSLQHWPVCCFNTLPGVKVNDIERMPFRLNDSLASLDVRNKSEIFDPVRVFFKSEINFSEIILVTALSQCHRQAVQPYGSGHTGKLIVLCQFRKFDGDVLNLDLWLHPNDRC